ncbi:hypothetical protein [Bradyrhizobium sp. 192]|uniref:hypothetical protein n=1 Tax=Bradyrhizobium sp. 192 TaxID=2782660 RepID=UPI001FFEDE13|nr:hypothetical protein [Bradyrhizobium sp. 192]UPJ55794.1 hypothetical protein IVB24_24445 [Bradyrhizobium sp. 192]
MLEMVRQQMICIIAPGWRGAVDFSDSGDMQPALNALLEDVAVIQFASIALLPARTDAQEQTPSLMLELAIEEGIDPKDMLYRLVHHPSGTMWSLFGSYWPGGGPPLASARNGQLFDKLVGWLSLADGGFVGPRDRTARQIRKERDLLTWTRDEGRKLRAMYGDDRASFALALAQRAFQDPRFDWAMQPSPRSYWRGKGASISAKVGYGLVVFGLWLALVWLLGALPRGLFGAYTWFVGVSYPEVQSVVDVISSVSMWIVWASVRALLALVGLLFLGWLLLVALPALSVPWRRWVDSVRRELERPTETWSSFSTCVVGWIVIVPLLVAILVCAVVFVFYPKPIMEGITALTARVPGWELAVFGVLAIVALLVIGTFFSWINRRFEALSKWFFHPYEEDVTRAQQVHPSIDQCEALLAGGTAHMVSLTDIRSPNGWGAWWIRVSLRIVTFFGRVFFTEGRLGDAPGIHFGHWHIIEGGRRFLFCSNYDGNFGGYLDDFINGATIGTTLAWRWTTLRSRGSAAVGQPDVKEPRDFPPTRFVLFRGVKCELKFKSYARDSMLPHMYRFDACNATIDEINLATGLRNALFGERNDSNDDFIMRAIET